MFTDKIDLHLSAGNGGDGMVAWESDPRLPKGGPNGGNGGRGGDIIFLCTHQVSTLDHFDKQRSFSASDGCKGESNKRKGKNGKELILHVPPGTVIREKKSCQILHHLLKDKESVILARGGQGGWGNAHFASSVRRAPTYSTKGKEGEKKELELEFFSLSDVGIVGFPNAGKTSLLRRLTQSGARVGDYPFTSLNPNLGYLFFENYHRILLSDIPGIIPGAHKNRGLGLSFLKHVHHAKMLLYLLDASGVECRDPWEDFCTLRDEMKYYCSDILDKPFIVVLNKMDLPEAEKNVEKFLIQSRQRFPSLAVYTISTRWDTDYSVLITALHSFFL